MNINATAPPAHVGVATKSGRLPTSLAILEALARAGNAQAIAALAANMDAGKCAICGQPLCGAGLGPWIDDEEYGDVHESCLEAKQ